MSLIAESLNYSVSGRRLLADVSIELKSGRIHAVLGPNGAGKSTLLRLLSGEWRPKPDDKSGQIHLNRRALLDWTATERARQRAVLPQTESLRFGFTSEQVVTLGRLPCLRQTPSRESEIVREALDAAGVTHLAQRKYPTLSGGERSRVQFGRVLAQIWEPVALRERFLLLDEPTANLDLVHQHSLLATARRFAGSGVGVLTILHDPNLALAYANEVTLLKEGRLLAQGPAAQTLTPENLSQLYGIEVLRLMGTDGAIWLTVRRNQ